jgi:hypothetical protein
MFNKTTPSLSAGQVNVRRAIMNDPSSKVTVLLPIMNDPSSKVTVLLSVMELNNAKTSGSQQAKPKSVGQGLQNRLMARVRGLG